jgi:superfamily II DNA or RNA helicase
MNYLYCKYLDDELDYFLDMYYFYEDYTEDEEDKYRKFYLSKYSPIRAIHKALESNQYKFGHHIKYVNEKIDIQLILNNLNCKLEFKD